MQTTPRKTVDTAFRTGTYPVAVTSPMRANRSDVASLPAIPALPQVAVRPRSRRRAHQASLALPVGIAALSLLFGIGYLSAQAQETTERNRTMKLQAMLKQEQELQQRLQNQRAQMENLTYIGTEASKRGMIRYDQRSTLIVGKIPDPRPAPVPAQGTQADSNLTQQQEAHETVQTIQN